MRFLADMGIAQEVVAALRLQDHSAEHLLDLGMDRAKDREIIARATTEKRIVLTHDKHFGRELALSKSTSPSIVTFRLRNMTPRNVMLHLVAAIDAFEEELRKGAAVTIDGNSTRCRLLPIE